MRADASMVTPVFSPSSTPVIDSDALARKQAELELIGSVTSHDLRAPVRILSMLCEQLSERPQLKEDSMAREIVQSISDETARLRTMIDGLLDYVRLETFAPPLTPLDVNEIITSAREVFEGEANRNGTTILCDPLPRVVGHRGRLTRLFLALFDNAVKFRSELPPVIRVSAVRKDDRYEFAVADNGIGIEEEQQDVIYKLFQRLHADDDYPGYGIGLALAAKIVATHGGKLSVESAPGKGSTFRFTLRAAEPA